jgi:hypothetical protein
VTLSLAVGQLVARVLCRLLRGCARERDGEYRARQEDDLHRTIL